MPTQVAYSWQPSTARIVTIEGFGPYPRGVLPVAPPPLIWPVKDPGDVLDYVIDLSDALAGNTGDAIATLDVTIVPGNTGDLTLRSSSADGDQAILWLGGGIAGTSYDVNIVVGTNSGRVFSRTVTLPVQQLLIQPTPPDELTDQNDTPITDQTGAPLTTE